MKSVHDLAAEIVAREGGYVNDPDDPGGPTKHGVTLGAMKALGIDLNRDGRVDITDVKSLPMATALDIFLKQYFYKPGLDQLPLPLQPGVFDMQVNSGANAIKLLQRMLIKMGYVCRVDGVLGLQTIMVARSAFREKGFALADDYAVARRDYYYSLADSRPASRKYARRKDGSKGGWITRAEEFMRPELRLTDAQHRARVINWP